MGSDSNELAAGSVSRAQTEVKTNVQDSWGSVLLKVVGGPHVGREFQFREHDNLIVGRGKQAHFRLSDDDRYFSRMHFLVEVNPPNCRLLDLGSRNGTRVNDQLVLSVDLKNGDIIAAGKTRIQVVIEMALSAAPIPAEPAPPLSHAPAAPEIDTLFETGAHQIVSLPEISGFELLPDPLDEQLVATIHDPHHCLPPDYRSRIRKHPQPIAGFQLISSTVPYSSFLNKPFVGEMLRLFSIRLWD